MFQFKQKNEFAYVVDGIFIRLAYILINHQAIPSDASSGGSNASKQSDSKQSKDSKFKSKKESVLPPTYSSEDSKKNKEEKNSEMYDTLPFKLISHEYKTNNVIADSIQQLVMSTPNNQYVIRVKNLSILKKIQFLLV